MNKTSSDRSGTVRIYDMHIRNYINIDNDN